MVLKKKTGRPLGVLGALDFPVRKQIVPDLLLKVNPRSKPIFKKNEKQAPKPLERNKPLFRAPQRLNSVANERPKEPAIEIDDDIIPVKRDTVAH